MCGIVGYTGGRKAKDLLLEGIRRLEYRGYDSAGMALMEKNGLHVYKKEGKIQALADKIKKIETGATQGIAHTRWATHGEPNEINAHPHTDDTGDLAIVHNGIIENYRELKKFLAKKGHVFRSETDSEVLAHLFEEFYSGDLHQAVLKGLQLVEGAYGICVVHKDHPDTIVGARKGSPLILGLGNEENFLVSDVSAIVGYTRNVIYLDDGELAVITPRDFKTYRIDSYEEVDKKIDKINWDIEKIEKNGFAHFMLKEIFEQPLTVSDAFRGRILPKEGKVKLGGIPLSPKEIRDIKRVCYIACGTSWHAGILGKYLMEELARVVSEHEYASEFRYRNPVISPDDLFISISQSGETADTLAALKLIREKGTRAFGITNVVGSSIARETDGGVYTHAGPEIGVASTKAFTSQLVIVTLMAIHFARANNAISDEKSMQLVSAMEQIPDQIEAIFKKSTAIQQVALKYKDSPNALYLGRGLNYPIALEGALKLKEISYIHAEGYPAAEMKHGPIALIDENMPCFVIATQDHTYEKVLSNIKEIKARKGKVIVIANDNDDDIEELVDDVIYVPKTDPHVQPILNTIPLQLIAYYIAVSRGLDVDKPRNLAKSVTVE
jgi:glucosamine--fructose-6-phosphate aminotransferase (isomerizing)